MNLQSLGCQTDLTFVEFDGEVLDRGDYLVMRTPDNVRHYWGNYVAIPEAPNADNWDFWIKVFDKEIAQRNPGTRHIAIGWDAPTSQAEFVSNRKNEGFLFDESVVLTASKTHAPPKFNPALEIRPLKSASEWEEATEIQILCRGEEYSYEDYAQFKRPQMLKYQKMIQAGLGQWFGAFLGGRMAGNLGIFRSKDLGRFQIVGTHPEFRRQGVCGTLVYQSSQVAFGSMDLSTLVMVADENYHAAKIYESVGFRPSQKHYGLFKWW